MKKGNFIVNKIYENWVTTTSFWTISGFFVGRVFLKGASEFSYSTQITCYKKREFYGRLNFKKLSNNHVILDD